MVFLREKPNVLIDTWSWTAEEVVQRLRGCDATEAGLIALSKLTTDTAGADEALRIDGLTKLVKEDRPPLIGLTVTRPKVGFGRAGRFFTETIRGIKPLVDIVRIDSLTETDLHSALISGQLLLPCYPNAAEHVALPINKFGEFTPDALYILKPVIVKEVVQNFGFITG